MIAFFFLVFDILHLSHYFKHGIHGKQLLFYDVRVGYHSFIRTPYSKMATILVFFCFHANWPLWPRSRLNILLNFAFESEAIRANLHGNKRILIWRPFRNKVCT